MKQNVIKFLQNLPKEKYEQFNEAFELYRKSPGKNPSVERSVNAAGFSERSLENLLYDLQKLHGITDVEKVSSIQMAVVGVQMAVVSGQRAGEVESENKKWSSLDPDVSNLFQTLLAMSPEQRNAWGIDRQKQFGDVYELLVLTVCVEIEEVSACLKTVWDYISETTPASTEPIQVSTEVTPASTEANLIKENQILESKKEDLEFEKADLEEELEASTEEVENLKDELKTLKSLPKINAKSIRVEFPFLNDAACPDDFKILIADKITAWNEYLDAHEQIFKIHSREIDGTEEETAALAEKAVKAFDENQKIYDELNAYQTTGKVLGLHPIFKKLQLTREVEEMTADELHKYKGSSAKYFTDNRKSLAKAVKAKDTVKQEEINSRVAERELKLALVNKKLGIIPK